MLRQRVITALVLVSIMLAALSAGSAWPFAVLTLVLIAAAAWEWGRLNQAGSPLAVAMGLALAAAGAWALGVGWTAQAPATIWWLTLALWLACGWLALRAGPA
ncbi:MAG TPA: phosphatidate cytidylyltransferase, partial [Rubrivivax sp.]|nr:phosphatidate cytidylyltransferase [Rubrivivax sp.]